MLEQQETVARSFPRRRFLVCFRERVHYDFAQIHVMERYFHGCRRLLHRKGKGTSTVFDGVT